MSFGREGTRSAWQGVILDKGHFGYGPEDPKPPQTFARAPYTQPVTPTQNPPVKK